MVQLAAGRSGAKSGFAGKTAERLAGFEKGTEIQQEEM
jgi:hypothetical protein